MWLLCPCVGVSVLVCIYLKVEVLGHVRCTSLTLLVFLNCSPKLLRQLVFQKQCYNFSTPLWKLKIYILANLISMKKYPTHCFILNFLIEDEAIILFIIWVYINWVYIWVYINIIAIQFYHALGEIAKDGKSFWLSSLAQEPWKSKVKHNAIFTFNI